VNLTLSCFTRRRTFSTSNYGRIIRLNWIAEYDDKNIELNIEKERTEIVGNAAGLASTAQHHEQDAIGTVVNKQ